MAKWQAMSIAKRQDLCRKMIDGTPRGEQLPPQRTAFMRDVVFEDQRIVRIWRSPPWAPIRFRNAARYISADFADGARDGLSWKKWCHPPGARRIKLFEDSAIREAFNKHVRRKHLPPKPCVNCGALHERQELDHVRPQFKDIAANLARPLELDSTGEHLAGASLQELIQKHAGAVLEWVCPRCHKARTKARQGTY